MTDHPESYPPLSDSAINKHIRKRENKLSERGRYYIPESEIRNAISCIREGDIIAITCNIHGLDIAHTGLAVFENNELHLLHASSIRKQVVISEKSLPEMLETNTLWDGIMIGRFK